MPLTVKSVTATESAEHENTVTEGALYQETFPANFWVPGKRIRSVGGCIVNDSNSTDTLTPRLRFGADGTTVTNDDQVAVGAAVDVADNDVGSFNVEATCEDVGDGTYRLVFAGVITDVDAPAVAAAKVVLAVTTAFNPAVPTYLSYTMDWSVASADNEVAGRCFAVDEITQ